MAEQAATMPMRMRGPDFILGEITSVTAEAEATLHFRLSDGSTWAVSPHDRAFAGVRDSLEFSVKYKRPLFVSGNKSDHFVEGVALPRPMRPAWVDQADAEGKQKVAFEMSPSIYYLWCDRPWQSVALTLLEKALEIEKAGKAYTALLVTIDVATLEIMDVREAPPSK